MNPKVAGLTRQGVRENNRVVFLIVGFIIFVLLASVVYVFYINKPKTSQDYIQMGEKFFYQRDFDKALEYFDKAVELDPANSKGYAMISTVYFGKKDYVRSLVFLEKAEKLNPNNPKIHNAFGLAYLNLKMYEPALKEFRIALRLNPDRATLSSIYKGIERIPSEYLEQNLTKPL